MKWLDGRCGERESGKIGEVGPNREGMNW